MRILPAIVISAFVAAPAWADSINCTVEEIGNDIISRCEVRADKAQLERDRAELTEQLAQLGRELRQAQKPPSSTAVVTPDEPFSALLESVEGISADAR